MKQTFDWDKLGVNRQVSEATGLISWGYYISEIILLFADTSAVVDVIDTMSKSFHTRKFYS